MCCVFEPKDKLTINKLFLQERYLQVLMGEASTPADQLLLELGLLGDVDGRRVGGWGSQLHLRLNGTEYLRQAVTSHIIRYGKCCAICCGCMFFWYKYAAVSFRKHFDMESCTLLYCTVHARNYTEMSNSMKEVLCPWCRLGDRQRGAKCVFV